MASNSTLLELVDLRALPEKASICVYFLWLADDLQYVGGTKSFNSRMTMHSYAMSAPPWVDTYMIRVRYDRVTALACEKSDLRQLERAYIAKYRPPSNVQNNPEKHPDYGK